MFAFEYGVLVRAAERSEALRMVLLLTGTTLFLSTLICIRIWYFPEALLASLLCLLIELTTAYGVFYTLTLMVWLLNQLNFLVFMVPALMVWGVGMARRRIPPA